MPFGLDMKSVIVGMLIMWLVVPWILGMLGRARSKES